ncbi:hypothetical protein C8Q75DRAFT_616298 [Abortiporus biennis]|nr:hypothetical protein C8Q75DRAFT_616298 [Abortiporus biennis]
MHRCLNVVEMIQNISDNILMDKSLGSPKAIVPEDETGNSSDLLAFALTCRKFYEPAIDSLWYTVETIHPLTCLFPDDLFEEGKEINRFITSMPIRPMKPSD